MTALILCFSNRRAKNCTYLRVSSVLHLICFSPRLLCIIPQNRGPVYFSGGSGLFFDRDRFRRHFPWLVICRLQGSGDPTDTLPPTSSIRIFAAFSPGRSFRQHSRLSESTFLFDHIPPHPFKFHRHLRQSTGSPGSPLSYTKQIKKSVEACRPFQKISPHAHKKTQDRPLCNLRINLLALQILAS